MKLNDIKANSNQPRSFFDENSIKGLAASIKSQGLLMPILVKKDSKNQLKYTIIAGERRWRACKLLGFKSIKAIIVDNTNEKTDALAAIIENVQREDLSALEEAVAYEKLIKNYSMRHEDIAKTTGKSRSYITNLIRILSLEPQVKEILKKGKISFGHARALLGSKNQISLANKIIKENLSVREVEELMKLGKGNLKNKNREIIVKDPNILDYEKYLSLKLGYKVEIKDKQGKGYLLVRYKDLEQLDAIVELFNS